MPLMKRRAPAYALAILAVSTAVASAQQAAAPAEQGAPPAAAQPGAAATSNLHPPREPRGRQVEACKGLTSGAACSFVWTEGKVNGICVATGEGKPLGCWWRSALQP